MLNFNVRATPNMPTAKKRDFPHQSRHSLHAELTSQNGCDEGGNQTAAVDAKIEDWEEPFSMAFLFHASANKTAKKHSTQAQRPVHNAQRTVHNAQRTTHNAQRMCFRWSSLVPDPPQTGHRRRIPRKA